MSLVSLMVIYKDDSVEVQFADGSSLQLSPCGSEFMMEKGPAPNMHPLQSCQRVRQRTPFVISCYKEQVLHALEFRNRFASRPYLPADLIAADKLLNLYLADSEVKWPSADREDGVTITDDGHITVSSLGGDAFLHLSPSRLEFTVEFLAQVSQPTSGKGGPKPLLAQSDGLRSNQENVKSAALSLRHSGSGTKAQNQHGTAQEAAHPCKNRGSTEIYSKYMHQYTWVVQHHTVSWCPPEWRHPLNLALHHDRQQDTSQDPNGPDEPETLAPVEVPEVTTVLSRALPFNCSALHFHRWRYRNVLGQRNLDLESCLSSDPVKVVWCQGVIYRVIAGSVTSVEVYPGDGSVLKPHDAMSKYYTHFRVGNTDGQGEERIYRVSNLPPDTPSSKYSICSMITQAIRILQRWNQFELSLKPPNVCCWRMEEFQLGLSNQLPNLLAEEVIWNVGRFLAFSDGRVHVIFCNGVRLNTTWDFGSQHKGEGKTLIQHWNPLIWSMVFNEAQANIVPGCYQLLFPDGSSQMVQMHSAGSYERYVTATTDWCRRVIENSQARGHDLPSQEVTGPDENWSVVSELQKIQRLNFLLENTSYLKHEPPSPAGPAPQTPTETTILSQGGWTVEAALKETSRAIQDIEQLLGANQKVQVITAPSKDSRLYVQQRDDYLEHVCQLAIRHISVVIVLGSPTNSTLIIEHYQTENEPLLENPEPVPVSADLIGFLRKEFGMSFNEFFMVLIDYDMKVKQFFDVPIPIKVLVDYMDTFPSRLPEIQEEKRNGITCLQREGRVNINKLLARLQGKRRLLIISTPYEEEWTFQQQILALNGQECNLGIRHFAVLKLMGSGEEASGSLDLFPANGRSRAQREKLSSSAVNALRKHFQVTEEHFMMLLVGKDGAIASWYLSPVWSLATIYDQVDSTQLRQDEMKLHEALGIHCHDEEHSPSSQSYPQHG
ncbi:uncharacterized protein C5orf34 homolog isoform X2 [Narcine bancroftii]